MSGSCRRVNVYGTQVTFTPVTSPCAVPEPFATVQVWPAGCVATTTAYLLPLAICNGNVNAPSPAMASRGPPLFHRASDPPEKPVTLPLTVTNWLSSSQFWLEPHAASPRHRPSETSRRDAAKIDETLRMMFTACLPGKKIMAARTAGNPARRTAQFENRSGSSASNPPLAHGHFFSRLRRCEAF